MLYGVMQSIWRRIGLGRRGPDDPDRVVAPPRRGGGFGEYLLHRPQAMLLLTFAGLITLGTILLLLPAAHTRRPIGFVDALFTATSAVCVTGLITVDTATDYSRFGQVVILVLIQLGALGIMTFGALAAELLHLRMSFSSQAALRDMFFQQQMRGKLAASLWGILATVALAECAGALLLYAGLAGGPEPRGGGFEAVFLAVSAFCNAGFSVYSDNVMGLRQSLLVVWTLMALIVLGGIGYPVVFECAQRAWARLRRRHPPTVGFTLHARVVLWSSLWLTLGGAAALLLTGGPALGTSWPGRALDALFQSVTARTAGFNTVPIGALALPGLLVLIPLMFVGGSPGSCAGGIKTTTFAVWVTRVWTRLRGGDQVALFGRVIPHSFVRRAGLILAVAVLWNGVGVLLLSLTESGPEARLEQLLFEQISAFGTVGLSTGLTPALSGLGKLWIIATMFVGRLGPLTVAFAVMPQPRRTFEYPREGVMIG